MGADRVPGGTNIKMAAWGDGPKNHIPILVNV
jgi:hypothetical protein